MVSVFCSPEPESLGEIVVDVIVFQVVVTIEPFYVDVGCLLRFAVAIVDEEPADKSALVSNILEVVPISIAVHVRVGIGWEVQNAALKSAYPHCQGSIAQVVNVLLQVLVVHSESESKMPCLLLWESIPSEPSANCIFVGESHFLVIDLV